MRVLFAVSNEEVSEAIVKRYQKDYKEIISYKNVYYFNAIIKELQKDKNYDRIVISEELEAFTNTQYAQIDKFIFDKLDKISDEASNLNKDDEIPIILICSDRREKSEEMLVKIFGIGIYNALLGNDRSVSNVCKLLNKPRLKKDAKVYYDIDSDDVSYQSESENDVSEVEIQNILAHYKRLGKNEKKYVESFDNIASQYNDTQLRIICKFLPLNVRAVLEEQSPKYQQLISYNSKISNSLRKQSTVKTKQKGTSEKLLLSDEREKILSKPVVIPSSVNMHSTKKYARIKTPANLNNDVDDEEESITLESPEENYAEVEEEPKKIVRSVTKVGPLFEENNSEAEEKEDIEEPEEVKPVKKRRGRPRKNPLPEETEKPVKKRRGRPRKTVVQEEEEPEETVLPGIDGEEDEQENTVMPGIESKTKQEEPEETVMPGIDEEPEETVLPGISETPTMPTTNYDNVDISSLLTPTKRIACFVGTTKNGTSFVVNNLADITSKMGIDTAILDVTKNRNSYYIYTKNEEELRKVAMNSIQSMLNGTPTGIQVAKNLTVYTSLPDETEGIENAGTILKNLLGKHSLILIDCDFGSPYQYFEKAQEIYLVQSFDILTIQPLTAFLRNLKAKNILVQSKLRVVLNKALKLRGVHDKVIIGGMAFYNDPAMSYMTELFDKDTIKYITIPFNEEVYTSYLENIINCEVTTKNYPKQFTQILTDLANMVYPMSSGRNSTYIPPTVQRNANANTGVFSPSMTSTLNQMKNRY